ncbi:MAG: hypothetical protein JAY64_05850 [Candidatus Thiodiazotropha weberae]|nr:hypothetical protein [Candidatus Thiodiazotropha lotti]MCG8011209.1 hypothetical protein [Candidatus Thiodiazotropha lotti]MCW4210671.1 hypothetical protein [Candidatus Thiodiazotropha lotti]MCW4215272.1 hypothetical protein [Candidatus Thiodiazotropha lotti]
MPNIQKQIESLKAEITRLEKEQQKAEQQEKALKDVSTKISSLLKESGVSFESYITHHIKRVSRVVEKLEAENSAKSAPKSGKTSKSRRVRKPRRTSKPTITVKIPAGRYGKLPNQPEAIFEVKEKGPRPKILKAYAEEVGLETFLDQCRMN